MLFKIAVLFAVSSAIALAAEHEGGNHAKEGGHGGPISKDPNVKMILVVRGLF